jgi:hypothetical protein
MLLPMVSLSPFMVMSILEMPPSLILLSAMDSRMSSVESKVPNFQADKSKELLLPEPLSENQEFFSSMKQLQLWMKTPRRKFKKLSTMP